MRGKTVLVVENDWLIADALKDDLVDMGCTVLCPALTSSVALSLLAGTHPDLAFIAAKLGNETGEAVASSCQKRGIPVVICSAYDVQNLPAFAVGLPLMLKPYRRDDVAKYVKVS